MEMEEPPSDPALTPRARRALVLIALAVLVLVGSGLAYVGPTILARGSAASTNVDRWLPSGATPATINFFDRTSGWVVLTAGQFQLPSTILRTSDGGHHWVRADVPGAAVYSYLRFFDHRHAMVSVTTPVGQILYATEDGGAHWKSFDLPGNHNDVSPSLAFIDPLHGLYLEGAALANPTGVPEEAAQAFLLWRTSDGGSSWTPVLTVDAAHPQAGGVSYTGRKFRLTFFDRQNGYFISSPADTFFMTHDAGLTWEPKAMPPLPATVDTSSTGSSLVRLFRFPDGLVELVTLNPVSGPTLKLSSYSRISADGGSTWTGLRAVPGIGASIASATPDFQDSRRWLIGEGRRLWRTADAGETWRSSAPQLPQSLTISEVQSVGRSDLWAIAADGAHPRRILHSGDAGAHWEDLGVPSLG
jgi:photosystem II stability/assembly factor-like uncharacterized protein